MHDEMDPLARMAHAVRTNPLASGREIAHLCGWAETKSIYYWLHKFGYSGLPAFRAAVLGGQLSGQSLQLAEPPLDYLEPVAVPWPPPDVAWAYRWHAADALPLVQPGDVLIGEHAGAWRDGDLMLYREQNHLRLARVFHIAQQPLHWPVSPGSKAIDGLPPIVVGRVTGIVRSPR